MDKLNLSKLIDKVAELEEPKNNRRRLHRARELRNYLAHPDKFTYMGGAVKLHIISLINVINRLFLDVQKVVDANEYLREIAELFAKFRNGLFLLRCFGERLITRALPLYTHFINGAWYSFWYFEPIQTQIMSSPPSYIFEPPIVMVLRDVNLVDENLLGIDIATELEVRVCSTDDPRHLTMLQKQQHDLTQVDIGMLQANQFFMNHDINEKLERLQYRYCWV